MGFATDINTYFESDLGVFAIILYSVLFLLIAMFAVVFVHGLKGTKYPFVLWMALTTIADLLVYAAYSYFQIFRTEPNNRRTFTASLLFFLSISIFLVQHWVLAFTYYKCAQELPYVFHKERYPEETVKRQKVLYWSVIVASVVSTLWVFMEPNQFEWN